MPPGQRLLAAGLRVPPAVVQLDAGRQQLLNPWDILLAGTREDLRHRWLRHALGSWKVVGQIPPAPDILRPDDVGPFPKQHRDERRANLLTRLKVKMSQFLPCTYSKACGGIPNK